jgi:GAF domain-containing protein
MIKNFGHTNGIRREQLKYFILAAAIAWVGGGSNYMITMGLNLYPFLNLLIALYPTILVYAIIRHRLLDISVALTRTTIFIVVYSVVLGIPFLLAFGLQRWLKTSIGDMWWLAPMALLTLLATAGPFIYLYIQRRAEEKIFQDQRRYQATLRQAATGMGRIKDMEKLIGLIVHIVTRSVRVEHSMVFLKDPGGMKYRFEGARSRRCRDWDVKEIGGKSWLVRALNKTKKPIVYSELKQRAVDLADSKIKEVVAQMKLMDAELVVPSFIDDNLIAFLVMGQKVSGEIYSGDDIAVFSILAGQAALAIENCQFYRDMRATHEQLFQAEKMATIGILADGLSHQINNRLHALGFIAGDALDTISLKKDLEMSDELKDVFVDLEHALTRVQENVTQGGEIVRGLLKYSRKQDEKFYFLISEKNGQNEKTAPE